MTGDPDKEYGTNKPPPTRRVRERLKGDTECPSTLQNPSCYHPFWLSNACATRKDSELGWLAKDHLETNPITIKPEQFSWVPLPYCSPPGCPFPIKSLVLSARVSLDNSFPSVRQEPSFRPWKGSPFLQQNQLGKNRSPSDGELVSVVKMFSLNFCPQEQGKKNFPPWLPDGTIVYLPCSGPGASAFPGF